MSKKLCSKCGSLISRFLLWRHLTGRYTYLCPRCGVVCSYCVERYARPVVACKYCGSEVIKEKGQPL